MIHGDVLGERARLSPERTALVEVATGRRLSYRQLDERAVRCARLWRETLGLARGERVGVLSRNRVELLDALFAAAKSGIVAVPLSTRATPHELAQIVGDSGLTWLFYSGEQADTLRALRRRVELAGAVAFDAPAGPEDLPYGDAVGALPPSPWRRDPCLPEDLYALLYTSGTTGRPKGVMIPHRMVAWNAVDTALCWQLREDDVSPVFTPLYHAGGLGAFLFPTLAAGGTVVLHAGFDAGEVWRTAEAERCTVILGVPTIWKLLLQAPELERVDLSHVRWLISGGAPLPRSLVEAYRSRGLVLKQGYGLTEVGVNCFSMSEEEAFTKAGSIGRPLMFTEARLVDEEGAEVATGEVGELLLRGPHVSLGYWGQPQATARALDTDGWFHTGDLARRDEDGFFSIAGRLKDLVISGGVNLYPAEIEGELLEHPGVRDAAVVGVPHPTWGETPVAFVVPAEAPPAARELAAFLAARLARYKVPRDFVFADGLPRTPYGKVVKGELRDRYLADHPELAEDGGA